MKFLVIALLATFTGNGIAQDTVDAISMEYPPFTTATKDNHGISFALLKSYAKRHFKVAYRPLILPPARAHATLARGTWCISFFPPGNDSESKFVALSNESVKLGLYRIAQPSEFTFNNLHDLNGSVAFLRSKSLSGVHKIIKQSPLKIHFVETVEQGIRMLLAGRVDYAYGDNTTRATLASKHDVEQLQFSHNALLEVNLGFFYNLACETTLFGDAHQNDRR